MLLSTRPQCFRVGRASPDVLVHVAAMYQHVRDHPVHVCELQRRILLGDLLCRRERLNALADGRVALQLKTPWHDGTTHVIYEPLDFVAKLAALIPRPHKNLVLYHGVLAANAAWRSRAVAYARAQDASADPGAHANRAAPSAPRHARWQWGEMMRRALGYDLLSCPNCGGKMKLLAVILERATIRRILAYLRLPTESPTEAVHASCERRSCWRGHCATKS